METRAGGRAGWSHEAGVAVRTLDEALHGVAEVPSRRVLERWAS